jgi:predicted transcriptional regulator
VSLLKTHPHEFGANLLFTEHDLKPYWAFRSVISDHGGGASEVVTVEHEGRSYDVSLGHQKSGLAPRPDDEIQTVYEYRVHLEENGNPERKADFLIQPRWSDMRTTEGKSVSAPDVLGVNVKTQGANIEFEEYPSLLRKASARLGVNMQYFEDVHDYSTVYDAARYVRVRDGKSDTIYGTNGTLRRVRELVADTGYTKLVSDDTEADGYYHTVTFGNEGASELLNHRYAKEIKHYHVKNLQNVEDALQHPKLETAYQNSKCNYTARWKDIDDLTRELDETLLNILSWSDLPHRDDGFTYIDDRYYENENVEKDRQILSDPTPELRDEQEARVIQHLRGMNDSDVQVLDELVSDGGTVTATELEEETDYSLATVYRALNRMDSLVNHEKGEIRVASEYMARRLNDAVQAAQERVRDALELSAEVVGEATEELERRGGALREWMQTYGVELEDDPEKRAEMKIERQNGRDIKEILREGLNAWKRAGREKRRFLTAEVKRYNRECDAWQYGRAAGFMERYNSVKNRR